jgi:hypothetical protein
MRGEAMLREIRITEDWSARLQIVAAVFAGLLLGLLLAWQVFPARWVDTDPSDLRAQHQAEYVAMVADSWTTTSDANRARDRLYQLVDGDTDWAAVDALISDTAAALAAEGNMAASQRVNRMRAGVPLPLSAEAQTAAGTPAGTGAVVPQDDETAPSRTSGWLMGLAGLGLLAFGAGSILYVLPMARRRLASAHAPDRDESPVPSMTDRRHGAALSLNPLPALGGMEEQLIAEGIDQEPNPADPALDLQGERDEDEGFDEDLAGEDVAAEDTEDAVQMDSTDGDGGFEGLDAVEAEESEPAEGPLSHMPPIEPEEAWHIESMSSQPRPASLAEALSTVSRALPVLEDDDLELVDDGAAAAGAATAGAAARPLSHGRHSATPARAAGQLGVFETSYQFGDDDFYHAFTIESPSHEFLGQCGIVISDVLGVNDSQLVDAFDVWLFETQGTRTISRVLVSEYAFNDKGIHAKLVRKGELVEAREGLVVPLETESIRLLATIEELEYRPGTPDVNSTFERLKIRMVVDKGA